MKKTEPSNCQRPSPPRVLIALRPTTRRLAVVADLTLSGYDVTHVGDGFQLLDHLPGPLMAIDLLVLGADLPSLSGLAVLRTLRKTGCDVPVLLVSDRPLKQVKMWHDERYTLEPPFDVWHIVQRIEKLVPPPTQPDWDDLLSGEPPRSWTDLWLQLEMRLRRDGLIHDDGLIHNG